MAKQFNVAAVCIPEKHYMVNIDKRLEEIKALIDAGKYFTINRARQYGKTTTLMALEQYLQKDYHVISMDFQTFGAGEFADENTFALSFADSFIQLWKQKKFPTSNLLQETIDRLSAAVREGHANFRLKRLFEELGTICTEAALPLILMIDEVDSAADNRIFIDFLSQLRACYIRRTMQPTFQSVILASVYDIRNLRHKLRPEEEHKFNSPWNIAADFDIDMSLTKDGICGMLQEYECDHHTGMNVEELADLLYNYTSGYPFLVSRLCQLMDEELCKRNLCLRNAAWTITGFHEAVKILLSEKNPLFESLTGKLVNYPDLNAMLHSLLFTGKSIVYNPDDPAIDIAAMLGFVQNRQGTMVIANRIFETRLYNFYLSAAEMQNQDIYKASLQDKNQFVENGRLNMRLVLEKFTVHFNDLFGDGTERFLEEEGRKYFLLYLRPIINGTGNYYIESRTRNLRRTDVIVDYHGQQYIIEMKLWRGEEYNNRGEQQLVDYLNDYHQKTGYMISFCFHKKKQIGVREILVGDKILIEATV